LPADLPATIFIVLHCFDPESRPELARWLRETNMPPLKVLGKRTKLSVGTAVDGRVFERGHAYLAPGGEHLLVERGVMRLERGPKEVHARPSIDVLFRSAAHAYGRRVVGVVLSGTLHDGTAGLWEIKKRGGITIVQDPREAEFGEMAQSAIQEAEVDHQLQLKDIARKLIELTAQPASAPPLAGNWPANVLIVEDERIVAMSLERQLLRLGYEVAGSVSSGEAAIRVARRTLPDVVLMDIHLAGRIMGTQAAKRIWEELQVPIVYLTAYADPATLDEVKRTEPYGYIVKPFRPEAVDAAVQLALDRRSKEVQTN
jgi:chemotaxis response regulator CheB